MGSTVGVSVVFTDLVGSTELATRVGAAEADRLRGVHFGLVRAALESHGGREVKNLGDGIMAVFPGVGAALDAAVAMQQGFDSHNGSGDGEPLMIRVGVATGDCTEEDGDYFGEPVIQAARLCAKAGAGRILAPEVVRFLAPRGRHEFSAVGDLELKGIPEPVAAVDVVWHPAVAEPVAVIPLPDRLAVSQPVRFVGRDAERAALQNAWKAACEGVRQVVLLSGEAGQGKTRLATEFAREVFDAAALVLYGRCDEELARPYGPWAEALGHLFAQLADDDLARLDARALSTLVPSLRERGAQAAAAAGEGDQYVLFAAVTDLCKTLTTSRPVVIVLDDLHWADRGTLQLLRHLVGHVVSASLLVVGTYRDTDVGVDDPLTAALAALRREGGVERIALVGLSDVDVIALMEANAGHEMGADGVHLSHMLRAETGGNPFFVGELLLHLAESGVIAQQEDGRWVATMDLDRAGIPQSVREVVGARVRRLGDDARRVLDAAAVVGREFDVAIIAGAMNLDEDAVLDVLEPALTAGLVAEVPGIADRFTFHALVQHTLYQDLPASRRARLHRSIAETIETRAGDDAGERAGELAMHWFAATRPADTDKAIAYAIRAGDQAVAAFAPDEAARWYHQALDAVGDRDDEQRCALLVRLGDAERQAGDPAHRQRLLEAAALAQRLGRDDLLVAAALANHRGFHSSSGTVDTERVDVLEAALVAVGQQDSPERARLLTTLASELGYSADHRRRRELTREAIAVARRLDDAATMLVTSQRTMNDHPDYFEERREHVELAMRLTAADDNLLSRFMALDGAIRVHLELADMPTVERYHAEQRAIADRLGLPVPRWMATYGGALIALIRGATDIAEKLATEALVLGTETGQPDAQLYFGSQLLNIRWHQGRDRELVPLFAQAVDDNPGLPVLRAAFAFQLAWLGDLDEARDQLDELAISDFVLPHDQNWLQATLFAAEAAYLLSDRAAASVMYERLAPHAHLIGMTGLSCAGSVAHTLGLLSTMLSRESEAQELFEQALRRHRSLEAPFFQARTLWELARLVRARDSERSRALLDEALALADSYGLMSMHARIVSTLADLHS